MLQIFSTSIYHRCDRLAGNPQHPHDRKCRTYPRESANKYSAKAIYPITRKQVSSGRADAGASVPSSAVRKAHSRQMGGICKRPKAGESGEDALQLSNDKSIYLCHSMSENPGDRLPHRCTRTINRPNHQLLLLASMAQPQAAGLCHTQITRACWRLKGVEVSRMHDGVKDDKNSLKMRLLASL